MDISGIAGAGKSHLLQQVVGAASSRGNSLAMLSPTDASVKDLRKAGFQARTFQGFQRRPERADLLVIDEASMLSVPQMLWLVKHASENNSRVLLAGDSAQHRSVERGDALRILEQSGSVRYTELLQTQRQKVPALKAAIEDLKAGRLQAGWEKLENHGVIKEITDSSALRERAVEQHLKALRAGKTSLMISPRHEEARKVASVVRERLKAEGAVGAEDYTVVVLRHMDLGPESCRAPIPSSCCMTGGECAGMVRASIKASALPLMQASAVRSTRLSCCRTALMRKPGMSAYRELEARCTSTRATRQSCVNR